MVDVRFTIFSSNFEFYATYFGPKSSVKSNKCSNGYILRIKWLKKIKIIKCCLKKNSGGSRDTPVHFARLFEWLTCHNNTNINNNDNSNNNNKTEVFSSDIGMDFGIEKCTIMVMKRGKLDKSEYLGLPNGGIMRSIGDDVEGYKYLVVLEADDIKHDEVKRSINKQYIRRVKKTSSSKLNAGNVIKAINS